MTFTEALFVWGAVALYAAALGASLVAAVFRVERVRAASIWGALAGLGLHFGAGIARWVTTGHAPVMYAYENALTGSFFVGVIFLIVAWRFAAVRKALPLALAVVLLVFGNGLITPRTLSPLEPPFRSGWLVVHVSFAWIAFGSFVVASVVAALCLLATRRGATDRAALFDDISGRLIALGFAADTVMIASGAIWAHGLWGRYWAWDPIETWSLVSWLVYGVNLHLRFTMGWKGPKAAWLALGSVATIAVTFFGIGVISDVHTELL